MEEECRVNKVRSIYLWCNLKLQMQHSLFKLFTCWFTQGGNYFFFEICEKTTDTHTPTHMYTPTLRQMECVLVKYESLKSPTSSTREQAMKVWSKFMLLSQWLGWIKRAVWGWEGGFLSHTHTLLDTHSSQHWADSLRKKFSLYRCGSAGSWSSALELTSPLEQEKSAICKFAPVRPFTAVF